MLKKPITYTDYNGVERTEDFYFNLSKAEIMEMELSEEGGFAERIKKIISSKDTVEIVKIFKEIILRSYGEKSADGKRFRKSKEMREDFEQTEAYSILFMELAQDPDAAADFVNQLVPADLAEKAKAQNAIAPNAL